MNFSYEGKDTLVQFAYPWLPSKCTACGKWGHLAKACLATHGSAETSETVDSRQNQEELEKVDEIVPLVEEGEIVERKDEVNEKDQVTAEDDLMANNSGKQTENCSVLEVQNTKTAEDEAEWSTVSPSKAAKSPEKLQKDLEYGQVSILSKTRFSILGDNEKEEEKEESDEEDQTESKQDDLQKSKGEVKVIPQTKVTPPQAKLATEISKQWRSLPRQSKTNHKIIVESSVQKPKDASSTVMNKKNSRKNH